MASLPGNADGTPGSYEGKSSSGGVTAETSYVEKVNEPIEVSPVASQRQGELLRYPISTNYGAEISFRVKSILPWDVSLTSAIAILRSPLIEKGFQYVKDLTENSVQTTAETPNSAVERERARFGAMERDLNAAQAAGAAFKAAKDKNAQENSDVTTDILGVKTKYVQEAPVVITYFPQALNVNDDVTYDTPELGPAGAAALGAINNGSSVLGALNSAIQEGLRGITDIFRGVNTGTAAKIALARAAQKGPASLNTAAAVGLQVKVNPNSRSVFNGVNIRQFPFNVTFTPRSMREASAVRQIIRKLKQSMAPKRGSTTVANASGGWLIQAPDAFILEYRRGKDIHPFLNKFKPTVLTSMSVNYTGAGTYASYADGNPVSLQVSLVFKELNPIYAEDYDKVEGGVGY